MDQLFKIIPGAIGVLVNRGLYKQAEIYERDGKIYAKWGSGFIGLRSQRGTTLPNVRWEYVEGVTERYNTLGAMIVVDMRRAAA